MAVKRDKSMKKIVVLIVFFFISFNVFAQRTNIEEKSPMSLWKYDFSVTLNGRTFGMYEVPQSWREQSGYALVNERKLFYWLFDTISYHDGEADEIYNKFLPYWVEKLGYVIDYDNIEVYNSNPNLASSVKSLMQQRGCDVSVTITTGLIGPIEYDIDFLVVNEYFKSKGVYKTTIYPLLLFYKMY
jgi:hypothetical protein